MVSDADTHSRSLGGVLALSSNIMEDKPETEVIQSLIISTKNQIILEIKST